MGQIVGSRVVWVEEVKALRYRDENNQLETLPSSYMLLLRVRFPEEDSDVKSGSRRKGMWTVY